jgi:nucleoside-diphosphate-sugar epimerase
VFNIGGGSRVSLNSTLERLSAVVGRPADVRRRPREDGGVLHTGADITRARERLVFAPSTSLDAGLAAEFEWAARARGHSGRSRRVAEV